MSFRIPGHKTGQSDPTFHLFTSLFLWVKPEMVTLKSKIFGDQQIQPDDQTPVFLLNIKWSFKKCPHSTAVMRLHDKKDSLKISFVELNQFTSKNDLFYYSVGEMRF